MGRFSDLRGAVKKLFDRYPRTGSAITGMLTFGMGDVLAQSLHREYHVKEGEVNWKQSAQVGALGLVSNGVFLPTWYGLLDNTLGKSMTDKRVVAVKVLADQLIYGPFTIITYFAFFCSIRSDSREELQSAFLAKLDHSLLSTWLADCTVWPIANFINFRYIPLNFRPVWTAFIQLIWQTYLAHVSAKQHRSDGIELADPLDVPEPCRPHEP